MTDTTDIAALRGSAECMANMLDNLAGYEPQDIDMDTVELRFEGGYGFDTGCAILIVDIAQQSADIIRALLDQLEAERQRADDLNYDLGQLQTNNVELSRECLQYKSEIAALKGSLGSMKDWEIDHSTDVPILVYKKCSVIESEQAYGLLNLIKQSELKGDQVPVEYQQRTKPKWDDHHPWSEWEKCSEGTYNDLVKANLEICDWIHEVRELFTAPQKPVEVSDSVAMQNVKDIAHCLSDIRRFVEAKFMTVGDLPSPEGLLLSGPEWKHESDAIIEALNRVADFYESQHVLKEIGYEEAYLLSPNNDRPDITHGFKFGWNAYHKAAIEAAGGIVKEPE